MLKLRNGLTDMELKPYSCAEWHRGCEELISIPAGLSSMNFLKFIVFTFAGSLIWSISLTFVGYTFGNTTQKWIESSSYIFNYIAIIIIVGIFGYIVYRFVKSR